MAHFTFTFNQPTVAEYCCPVWQRSTHVSLVDAQLHSSMHLISGTVWSTPLPWLPVLTNIEPPALRRRAATDKLIMQAECQTLRRSFGQMPLQNIQPFHMNDSKWARSNSNLTSYSLPPSPQNHSQSNLWQNFKWHNAVPYIYTQRTLCLRFQ